ncbi:methyltransferase domain-containing protein [Campylobacter sp. faydin G-24]|uniref:Methyltransferase domain-containing protein n=1 Tax=Campylobacter anatolicus TaxID=2829105 RepID=A0ABS5HK43_9BACT|nr:methyltransferase domain-containing protein [Campylobacter anatolicus]
MQWHKSKQNIWDKKADKYQRFDGTTSRFQRDFFKSLDEFGVDFNGKNVIDIGCGTGVYTLNIAQKCNHITGVDSSIGMLEILCKDANKFSIKNYTIQNAAWSEFRQTQTYDIAITTMSPAIQSVADFERFDTLAKVKIYLGWRKPRTSDLLEPFFIKFGRRAGDFMVSDSLQMWLEKRGVKFELKYMSEIRKARRSYDEALENICWHLEINGLKFDKKEVADMLKPLCKDGFVDEKINSLMSLLVF